MADARAKPYVSYADYLAAERDSDVKHEWFDGAVYAMSRGTPDHARLSARVGRVIGKEGRVANALRHLVKAAATKTGARVTVEIITDDTPINLVDSDEIDGGAGSAEGSVN